MQHILAAAVLAATVHAAAAQDIGGQYAVAGTNLDGSTYGGTATITLTSEYTCEILWQTGTSTSKGICMRDANAFVAGYTLQGSVGLVIYFVQPDGTLEGTWTVAGLNAVGTEVLSPM